MVRASSVPPAARRPAAALRGGPASAGRRAALFGVAALAMAACGAPAALPPPLAAPRPPPRPIRTDRVRLGWPSRRAGAPTGSAFAEAIFKVNGARREEAIAREILDGNVPDHLRELHPVSLLREGGPPATVWVAADYLAVGTDEDFLRVPLMPRTAQRLADALGCLLPTRAIVNAAYAQAAVRLPAIYMPPGRGMTTTPQFVRHHDLIEARRTTERANVGIRAGHKKDIVLTPQLARRPGRVAIYGFFRGEGEPIQRLSLVHSAKYVDYTHGVRLVLDRVRIDGRTMPLSQALRDRRLAGAASDEGPMEPRYR